MPDRQAREALEELAGRAILLDFDDHGTQRYVLPPPMTGLFEFSLMRTRGDIDQKLLAGAANHRAMAAILNVILALPPVKQQLAKRELSSRYLERLFDARRRLRPAPLGLGNGNDSCRSWGAPQSRPPSPRRRTAAVCSPPGSSAGCGISRAPISQRLRSSRRKSPISRRA